MKSCDGTKVISNNKSSKTKTQGGRHLGQYNPTIQLAPTLYDELFGQRYLFDNNMADKTGHRKSKGERSKGKEEKRKRKRSEKNEIELAKHYETL